MMSDPATTLAIISAVVTHGPDAVLLIAKLMNNKEPTAEDIKALFITKNPEDYFEG
jgi:hypothetical protein